MSKKSSRRALDDKTHKAPLMDATDAPLEPDGAPWRRGMGVFFKVRQPARARLLTPIAKAEMLAVQIPMVESGGCPP